MARLNKTVAELQTRLFDVVAKVPPGEWLANYSDGGCLMMRALKTASSSSRDYMGFIRRDARSHELVDAIIEIMDASDDQNKERAITAIRALDKFIPERRASDLSLRDVVAAGGEGQEVSVGCGGDDGAEGNDRAGEGQVVRAAGHGSK